MTRDEAVNQWFAARDAYHKASDAYNARLAIVRAARDEGDWRGDTRLEYKALNDAQRAAFAADEVLYAALVQQNRA